MDRCLSDSWAAGGNGKVIPATPRKMMRCYARLPADTPLLASARKSPTRGHLGTARGWRPTLRKRTIRRATNSCPVFLRSCSQIRMTRQPRCRSASDTDWSRARFRVILASQNAELLFGTLKCRGQPCQKQPSTNTATFHFWKEKSGRPGRGRWRRQPVMWRSFRTVTNANSVFLLPRERIRDINSERVSPVNKVGRATLLERIGADFGEQFIETRAIHAEQVTMIPHRRFTLLTHGKVNAYPAVGQQTLEGRDRGDCGYGEPARSENAL